ncbi:MAG: hypothetical protein K5892_08200, partial [Acholeplasmatales bacterium]|nr:hypothetical protein [Acholeplasmatales bacterium]
TNYDEDGNISSKNEYKNINGEFKLIKEYTNVTSSKYFNGLQLKTEYIFNEDGTNEKTLMHSYNQDYQIISTYQKLEGNTSLTKVCEARITYGDDLEPLSEVVSDHLNKNNTLGDTDTYTYINGEKILTKRKVYDENDNIIKIFELTYDSENKLYIDVLEIDYDENGITTNVFRFFNNPKSNTNSIYKIRDNYKQQSNFYRVEKENITTYYGLHEESASILTLDDILNYNNN